MRKREHGKKILRDLRPGSIAHQLAVLLAYTRVKANIRLSISNPELLTEEERGSPILGRYQLSEPIFEAKERTHRPKAYA